MNAFDKAAFLDAFEIFVSHYASRGFKIGARTVEAYWRQLEKFDFDVVQCAFDKASLEFLENMPSSGQLHQTCKLVERNGEHLRGVHNKPAVYRSGEFSKEERDKIYDDCAARYPDLAALAGRLKRNEVPCHEVVNELAQHVSDKKARPYGRS